ncbi:MAG: glycoside hydrolase family 3 C-terminal domain-containing protein [Clostridium sp.]|jgi:beta-glucosidase|nr:glycoside hydrolase family 3 C-terminal domain-containing protein [Clostridium sp.]
MESYQIGGRSVPEILSQMSLEEKAAFLDGRDFWHLESLERLGIPQIMVCDGPHGLRKQDAGGDQLGLGASVPATSFPTASLSACSWEPALLEEMGEAIAQEARANEVSVVLGPGVNMKRSPLCGRNFEYFSEDPFLAGELGAAWVRGAQGIGVGTSLKHFAANNQETRRLYVDTIVDERALRELYLPAFERVIRAEQPWTVMNSYNKINGKHGSENATLQVDILRGDWGFEGLVVSDWGAVNDRVSGVIAGNDLEMPSSFGLRTREILEAVKEGRLEEKQIDERVEKILELIAKSIPNLEKKWSYDPAAHHALARKIAAQSMVLLSNKGGLLPIKPDTELAVIGEMAVAPRYQGSGSSQINPPRLDSFCGCLDEAGIKYTYAPGYKKQNGKKDDPYALIPQAVQAAKTAKLALVFIGLTEDYESEGFDRTSMELPPQHNALVEAVVQANPNTVVVLSGGSPVTLPWFDKVPAVLNAYLGGQAGAGAVWDILSGKVNPCGKLAESYPFALEDTPSAANFPGNPLSVEYRESLYIGYRYYEKTGKELRFPFGYGLSYTTFGYSDIKLSKSAISGDEKLQVSCTITNTGAVDGAEVVQLYVGNNGGFRPLKELKGFAKPFLRAGESKTLSFELDKRSFAVWDTVNKQWRVPSGEYSIQIGASSADVHLSAALMVNSSEEPAAVSVPGIYLSGDPAKASAEDFAALIGRALPPTHKPLDEPITVEDTFELAAHTKWGGRITRIIRHFTSKSLMGEMVYAEATRRPLKDIIYLSGGLFSAEMANGVVQILNGKHSLQGFWRLIKGVPHLLLNIKKLLRQAF